MPDRIVDLYDLDASARELLSESEITGRRIRITRDGREIAMIITADEYVALTETISILGDATILAHIAEAKQEAAQAKLLEAEDLFVE